MRCPTSLAFSFLSLLCFAGCANTTTSLKAVPGQTYGEAMDDLKLIKDLETTYNKLVTEEKLTPTKDLASQLQRTKAKIKLPNLPTASNSTLASNIFANNAPGTLFFLNTYLCDKCHLWHVRPAGAWALTDDGIVVTNEHVIQAAFKKIGDKVQPGPAVADSFGNLYPVREILAVSKAEDIAILRVEASGLKALPVSAGSSAGEPVYVLSSPQQRLHALTNGMVSRYFIHREPGQKPVTRVAITAEYATGSSGSPVFNAKGAVIGMISSTSSLSADNKPGNDRDTHQMVVRNCVPVEAVLKMIEAP